MNKKILFLGFISSLLLCGKSIFSMEVTPFTMPEMEEERLVEKIGTVRHLIPPNDDRARVWVQEYKSEITLPIANELKGKIGPNMKVKMEVNPETREGRIIGIIKEEEEVERWDPSMLEYKEEKKEELEQWQPGLAEEQWDKSIIE